MLDIDGPHFSGQEYSHLILESGENLIINTAPTISVLKSGIAQPSETAERLPFPHC